MDVRAMAWLEAWHYLEKAAEIAYKTEPDTRLYHDRLIAQAQVAVGLASVGEATAKLSAGSIRTQKMQSRMKEDRV